jgi:L-alanine-DL-glutamate epimerase-like enolase superfamily enzyme
LGASFIEQPVAGHDLDGMRELRGLGIAIVADEVVFTEHEAFPHDIAGHLYFTHDVLGSPLDIDGERARLPRRQGRGVTLDRSTEATFA